MKMPRRLDFEKTSPRGGRGLLDPQQAPMDGRAALLGRSVLWRPVLPVGPPGWTIEALRIEADSRLSVLPRTGKISQQGIPYKAKLTGFHNPLMHSDLQRRVAPPKPTSPLESTTPKATPKAKKCFRINMIWLCAKSAQSQELIWNQ